MEDVGIMSSRNFYSGKRVLVTGHTGFKGMWLCRILQHMGADVVGYSLPPVKGSFYSQVVDEKGLRSAFEDIRDLQALRQFFFQTKPEIVFHLAAQPIVWQAYHQPLETFEINVQGTANLLECLRQGTCVKSAIIVTTDKVYRNNEWIYGYRENDALGDDEPYAASKACAEILSMSYFETYLQKQGRALSTVRAGNVIGGGDISEHRIIPDCIRAAKKATTIMVRSPHSVRPYQHVLEPLFAYLLIARKQYEQNALSGQYNIGPGEDGCVMTETLVKAFCEAWGRGQTWEVDLQAQPIHESGLLKLDCSKIKEVFQWKPQWGIKKAIAQTIAWEREADKRAISDRQIVEYEKEFVPWTH